MLDTLMGWEFSECLPRSLNYILKGADKIQKKYDFISPGNTATANRGIGRAMDRPPHGRAGAKGPLMRVTSVSSPGMGIYTAGRLA